MSSRFNIKKYTKHLCGLYQKRKKNGRLKIMSLLGGMVQVLESLGANLGYSLFLP